MVPLPPRFRRPRTGRCHIPATPLIVAWNVFFLPSSLDILSALPGMLPNGLSFMLRVGTGITERLAFLVPPVMFSFKYSACLSMINTRLCNRPVLKSALLAFCQRIPWRVNRVGRSSCLTIIRFSTSARRLAVLVSPRAAAKGICFLLIRARRFIASSTLVLTVICNEFLHQPVDIELSLASVL